MENNNISQSRRKGLFSGEKGPIIWQSRFTLVLLQVAFYVKARLCRSQSDWGISDTLSPNFLSTWGITLFC